MPGSRRQRGHPERVEAPEARCRTRWPGEPVPRRQELSPQPRADYPARPLPDGSPAMSALVTPNLAEEAVKYAVTIGAKDILVLCGSGADRLTWMNAFAAVRGPEWSSDYKYGDFRSDW